MVDPSRGPDLEWWQKARFGMFIHWGLYSLLGRGEWVMYQEHIPPEEYASLADRFNADAYNPSEWVALARDAGMEYMVITTRHHDGFCLYDSEASDFTAPKSAAGRDLVAEFVDACRSEGMRIGFYYSLVDWRFPGVLPRTENRERAKLEPMVKQAHAQVRELCTKYGKIDILLSDRPVECTTKNRFLVIEVKRSKVTVNNIVQLEKYMQCFPKNSTHGYIAGPCISANAAEYCVKKNIAYVAVEFS